MVKSNRYLQIGLLYFLTLFIHGCATRAQIQFQQIQQQAQETARISKACGEQAKASDVGKRLQRILIMSENDPAALEKMMIDRVASEAERRDFIDYNNMIQPCRTQLIEGYSKVHPLFVNFWAKSFAENDEMGLKIVKGDITLGEANAWMNKITPLRRQAFFDAGREVDRQLQSAHVNELQHRAAAGAALQQWSYQQQLLQQNQQIIKTLNRPIQSNCYFIGNNVSCTSY
jgi:hypothetical protein